MSKENPRIELSGLKTMIVGFMPPVETTEFAPSTFATALDTNEVLVDSAEPSLNSSSSGIGVRKNRKAMGKMSCRSVSRLKSTSTSPAVNIGNVRM